MRPFTLKLFFLFLTSVIFFSTNIEAHVWKQYSIAYKNHQSLPIPDFSYAGYKRGEEEIHYANNKIFDVTKYGAFPNDDKDDSEGVQSAINAASKNGGGIVFFPKGKFLFFTDRKKRVPIYVTNSHIVLKGSGSTKNGTILFQVHHGLGEPDPILGYTPLMKSLFLLNFNGKAGSTNPYAKAPGGQVLVKITKNSKKNQFSVYVDTTSQLKKNQWVVVYFKSKEAIKDFLYPYKPFPEWKRTVQKGISVNEIHQIKEIVGKKVIFYSPLKTDIKTKYNAFLRDYLPIENVGVEDICFMGNWLGNFMHHRSGLDDYAWQSIKMSYAVNSWIRRCSFINVNYAVFSLGCANSSYYMLRLAGTASHHSIHIHRGTDNFIGLFQDESYGAWHEISLGYGAAGTVFWRCLLNPQKGIDAHSGNPYASLYDRIDGGVLMIGSGGPIIGMPNHCQDMIFWNFNYQRDGLKYECKPLNFWHKNDGRNRPFFVKPILVGLHGRKVNIVKKTVLVNEAYGHPVKPESLYEAQLKLRLTRLPQWIEKIKTEWKQYRTLSLPLFFDPLKESNSLSYNYIETFSIQELIDELKKLPLKREKKLKFKIYTKKTQNLGLLKTDFNKLRQILFNLMSYAGGFSNNEGELKIYKKRKNHKSYFVCNIKSKFREPRYYYKNMKQTRDFKYFGQNKALDWDMSLQLASALNLKIVDGQGKNGFNVYVVIPEQ